MTDSTTATVFADLAAEVEIPKDGTLSRVLYKDDRLRMVIFAFDTDQELTEHSAPVAAIIQVISGRFHITLGDDTLEAGPGMWAHMSPSLPHSLRSLEPSVLLLTMLRGS